MQTFTWQFYKKENVASGSQIVYPVSWNCLGYPHRSGSVNLKNEVLSEYRALE